MFHHIIVPLDESLLAEQAIPIAAHIARASGGSLRFIHVVHDPIDYAWQYGEEALVSKNIVEADYSRMENYLKQITGRSDLQGIQVATEVLSGNPAQAILNASKANKADLIVICSHGYTGVKRWLLGSIARKLLHQSTIPTLLLHPTADGHATSIQANQDHVRVMVPLDGSSFAEEALAPAAALSGMLSSSSQGTLHLASILPISKSDKPHSPEHEKSIKQAQGYLMALEQHLFPAEGTEPQPYITTSITLNPDIAHALVELAESGKGAEQSGEQLPACDIIAIATHGRGALARWAIGSITERVLDTTRLPVLVIRPQAMSIHEEKHDTEHNKKPVEPQSDEGQSSWVGLL